MSISWQHKPLFSDPYNLYMMAILETCSYHFSLSRVGQKEFSMVLLPRVPKKGNITSPREFHIIFMTISKNLIKGKGGQLMDRLANHFIVWQNSMNTLEKILLGQDSHQLSGISQYILQEIKLF